MPELRRWTTCQRQADRARREPWLRAGLTAAVLLIANVPGPLSAQPFDLDLARRAVVRVLGNRGAEIGAGSS